MTLDRMPASGARSAHAVDQVEERLAASRTGASGAAAARWRAGRRCRSRARPRASRPSRRAGRAGSRPAAGRTPAPARCPATAASSGSIVSSSRRSPRSLPYDVEFSLTRKISLTPCSPSQRASASTSDGRRETNAPRNIGMAQNAHRRSQPLAIFSGAHGRPSSRARITRGPLAGTGPSIVTDSGARLSSTPLAPTAPGVSEAVAPPWPGRATEPAPCWRAAGDSGSSRRRSDGHVRGGLVPVRGSAVEVAGHVDVGVEPEHRVGLGQLGGELLAVPLGQAADGHDGLGAAAVLEVGGLEQRVDRVLLGLLDEAAGVDHGDVGLGRVVDQQPPLGGEPAGQLLGVDLVAGAAEGHEGDAAGSTARGVVAAVMASL